MIRDTPEEVTKKLNTYEEWVRFTRLDGEEIVLQRGSVIGATDVSGSAE